MAVVAISLAPWARADGHAHEPGMPPAQSLKLLQEGNKRFVRVKPTTDRQLSAKQRADLAKGQKPHAIILNCSGSRVPPEQVFDQGLGKLFVVRVAGNGRRPRGWPASSTRWGTWGRS